MNSTCYGCEAIVSLVKDNLTRDNPRSIVYHGRCRREAMARYGREHPEDSRGVETEVPEARSDIPHQGCYYQGQDGQKIEVITIATHRAQADSYEGILARKDFIIFRHGDGPTDHGTQAWCETRSEWDAGGWREIYREDYLKGPDGVMAITLSHKQGPWALVYPYKGGKGPRVGADIHVVKCSIYEGREGCTPGPGKVEKVRVGGRWPYGDNSDPMGVERGTPGRILTPLDGRVWTFRQDARRAKRLYMKANKIQPTSAAEVWGYEHESDGYY